MTNKVVKTDTWPIPPPNTTKEYFTPILLGLKVQQRRIMDSKIVLLNLRLFANFKKRCFKVFLQFKMIFLVILYI